VAPRAQILLLVTMLAAQACKDDGATRRDATLDRLLSFDAAPDQTGTPDLFVPDASATCPAAAVSKSCSSGFCRVPAGCFFMGSPESEPCRSDDERLHPVTLTRAFELGRTEVTQGEFLAARGYNPSSFSGCGSTCPVENVSWHEAAAYCNALSERAGLARCYVCTGAPDAGSPAVSEAGPPDARPPSEVLCTVRAAGLAGCPGYRLPTEAEWEAAYRAGTFRPLFTGSLDPDACPGCALETAATAAGWYCANASKKTHAVEGKTPNALGLHDLAGNVWEWCHDFYLADLGTAAVTDPTGATTGYIRVLKGGSWNDLAAFLRGAARFPASSYERFSSVGFRCARTLPAGEIGDGVAR
jgi:formylglycine-generating enzyme required for sulfatase activity